VTGHQHFTFELPSGYRSPWLWPTAAAATEYGAKAHPGEEVFLVEVLEDGTPVRVAGSHADIALSAATVKAWCGQRGSGDMMQRTAALRLDAGGVQVDIVGTATELVQVMDRIVAAFDRGLGSV
jgi:hypothetical protein